MALKTDLIQKALSRKKVFPHPKESQYSHFLIHKIPIPTESIILQNKSDINVTHTEQTDIEHEQNTNKTQSKHTLVEVNPNTNNTQSKHKTKHDLNTNYVQTKHNKEHKTNTNLSQTRHKLDTNRSQIEHAVTYGPGINKSKSEQKNSVITQDFYSLSSYIGVQKNILILFYSECKINRSKSTPELTVEYIATSLNIPFGSVKTSVKRLETKGAIKRIKFKNGRGGWSKYEINDDLYREIIQLEKENKLNTKGTQIEQKQSEKLDTKFSVYSSSNNINTTTRVEQLLPDDWKAINIEPLQEHGFSLTQLKQLYALNITSAEIVQESINHFAFGLKNNPKFKIYRDPLNVLMGVLRKGEVWYEKDYKSPKELAMEKIIKRKRAERERIKQLEEKLFLTALEEWKETKSEAELDKLLPTGNIPPRSVKISIYFKENIWPAVKKDYLI